MELRRGNRWTLSPWAQFRLAIVGLFALILALLSSRVKSASSSGSVLYDAADPLNIIDGTENFYRELRSHGRLAYMAQFYNSWCGHCIRYAPIFKEYANDVRAWQSAVDIGVINCAAKSNIDVCREQQITAYPSIKMYWLPQMTDKLGEKIEADRDASVLRKHVIDFVEKKIKEHGAPKMLTSLEPSRATTLEEMWASQASNLPQLLAVVEEESSYTGRELILDFSNNTREKIVRFIRGTGPEEIRNKDATSLLLIERGIHPRLIATVADNSNAREEFKVRLMEMGFKFERLNYNNYSERTSTVASRVGDPDKVYLEDVEAGLTRILNQDLMLHTEFDEKKLVIIRNFIQAIHDNVFLPYRIKTYLQKLNHHLDVSAPLKNADYQLILREANSSTAYLRTIENVNFIGCKGSKPFLRGFPCSMWTISHLMTVGSYSRYVQHEIAHPERALLIFRDFIVNFFSCEDCRTHFLEMAKDLENELKTPDETVLWLWRAHNKVNKRLAGDPTEDPARPKVQFPPSTLCADCFDSNNNFIESNVLKFLQNHYDSTKLVRTVSEGTPTAISLQQEATDNNSANASRFLLDQNARIAAEIE
ncbi:sulfhydryl oxidase 2-like isoform X2 [Varroa jacobsoni]|uniref:sulfhydryl oxidase 2-like isoform X2 n=1 Tax=Varroa jacobsoni TaxID=62625 RepID=UPI000BF5BABB|nr:sulfhydryl oxidase 2-like isoform X2 [Varroa jacobsoni]